MAHFKTTQLDYNSEAGDCDVCVFCTPTCELYFQMGVFVSTSTLQGELSLYPGACSYYEHEDGIWNYTDQELTRPLPDMTTSARYYFALFDDDPSIDEDDLLGTHYTSPITGYSSSSNTYNNDIVPAGHTVMSCNDSTVDDDGTNNRFNLWYSVWYTDSSAPDQPYAPVHTDDDAETGSDNDTTLDFNWLSVPDPNTGIDKIQIELQEDEITVDYTLKSGSITAATVCASDCTVSQAVSHGSNYRLRVSALNGASIEIQNPTWSAWSEWSSPVLVDLKYNIGVTVTGLAVGNSLTLQNNGGDDLVITTSGDFTFSTLLSDGSPYSVTVLNQPAIPSQHCTITNSSGNLDGADVTDILVSCVTTCQVSRVTGVFASRDTLHETCEILLLGPPYIAEDGASIFAASGWEIWFMPGFTIELGATLNANVCGQSLCMISDYPMPYGCHSCVNKICDVDSFCCDSEFDQTCLDRVDTVCGLVCE